MNVAIRLLTTTQGSPTFAIEVIGEPNRPAVVRRTNYHGDSKQEKTGDVPKYVFTNCGKRVSTDITTRDDVQELMSLISTVRGFPSHPNKDVYGLDTKLDFSTMEIQWSNQDEDPTAATDITEIADEQKDDFKRIADSIEALAREFAKKDSAM